MFARVNAVFGSRENAMVIPEEAIIPQGGRTFVVKVVPGEKPDSLMSERVAVKTGLRLPGKVEILDGLAAGDTVVTAGHQRLQKDGTVVRVVDLPASGGPRPAGAPGQSASAPASPAASTPASVPADASKATGAKPPAVAGKPGQAAAGKGQAPSGPNPCLRGADATR
jgi:membrane fusion protein (multidrug efflux system)